MIQFYAPEIKKTNALGPEDSAHCARVLRKKEGDTIFVTDGNGKRYECVITQCSPKKVEIEITSEEELPKSWEGNIELWVAPTKNMDRMEWLVEKSVELGLDRFVPLLCSRSERKVVKTDRLEKIAVSAMKQSLKVRKPEVDAPRSFREMLEEPFDGLTVMGYCLENSNRTPFTSVIPAKGNIRILIGPEGDFSPEEVTAAREHGVKAVTFGKERLRTETAGLAALHTVHVVREIYGKGMG